jgi:methionyl-tRNA synthetase
VLTQKYFDSKVPSLDNINDKDREVLTQMDAFPELIGRSVEHYRFREALNELMNLARLGNKYLTENEPWKTFKTDEQRTATVLAVSLQVVAKLSIVSEPFLPFTAAKLRKMISLDLTGWNAAAQTCLLPEGRQLGESSLLFDRIEDDQIMKQVQKLLDTKKSNQQASAPELKPQKETITYEDFSRMDIRTGTILTAEIVPKTQKLLKLTIDTGIDKRTVVSGIAEHYKPEDIIGQKVCILINLAPRQLKGIESNGMILMAENSEGKLCFVEPTADFHNGCDVK